MTRRGFTLIELSIVLVIIGLVTGGVLVGQDLINAASVRAQIAQIEKYQTAVNAFKGKYGYLPGDIPDPAATSFGLQPRGTSPGMGDGDGLITGFSQGGLNWGAVQSGEPTAFWVDLSTANMLDGGFTSAGPTSLNGWQCTITPASSPSLNEYLPRAKLGNGSYVLVWSGGWVNCGGSCGGPGCPQQSESDGKNYFVVTGLSAGLTCWASVFYVNYATPQPSPQGGMTVNQAYAIDSKIDDGLPQSGNVNVMAPAFMQGVWSGTTNACTPPYTTPTQGNATSCFDNGNANGVQHYSTGQNNGTGMNCSLSFRFQ